MPNEALSTIIWYDDTIKSNYESWAVASSVIVICKKLHDYVYREWFIKNETDCKSLTTYKYFKVKTIDESSDKIR